MPSGFQVILLVLGGPVCGVLALLLCAFRKTRPGNMGKWVVAFALAMVIPSAMVLLAGASGYKGPLVGRLGFAVFAIRPMIAFAAGILALGYFSRCLRLRLPIVSALPAGLMLVGAGLDICSVPVLILLAEAAC